MPEPVITLENVSYSYPRSKDWVLKKISLEIAEGEMLAVMGENGAGKSTFCKLFNGIIPHSQGGRLLGTVKVDGVSTKDASVPQLARTVGMVLDDPETQLFTASVRHEAAFGPENLLLPPDEIQERVRRALAIAGLEGLEDRAPQTLSGGEKQRLAIAAALAHAGKVLVMDEPVARLDPAGATEIFSVIRDIRKKHRLTVIMATDNSEYAAEFADRVCVLKNGTIAACDTPEIIFRDSALLDDTGIKAPDVCELAGFLSANGQELPIFPVTLEQTRIALCEWYRNSQWKQ